MNMTLYADMLFLVNFVMNTFVLWVVSKITRNKKKARWLFIGSAAMSLLYTLLIALEPLRFINVALSSVVILTIGIFIAFRPNAVKAFVKILLITYGISFTVGGLGMALFFLTDIPHTVYFIYNERGGIIQTVSWQIVLAGAVLSYVLIKLGLKFMEYNTLKRQMLCHVQVSLGEQDTTFDALVDTGHSLKEPLSQNSVIVVEFERVKEFLPDGLKILFYEKKENVLTELLTTEENTFYKRIRMIPFTSLGRANGMLIGFRPDSVTVEGKTPQEVIIGIYNDKLCKNDRYHGLLSPELIS